MLYLQKLKVKYSWFHKTVEYEDESYDSEVNFQTT